MDAHAFDRLVQVASERGKPFRILIADDERWVREVFRDYCDLTNALDVDLAHSGAEAVEKAKSGKYDLITLDIIMPEMSGLEALDAIKKAQPQIPIMIVTGNATDKLIREAGVLGACRVLYKPVLLEDFINELTARLVGPERNAGRAG